MPLLDKKFNILTNFWLFVDMPSGGASTTLTAAALKNATTLAVTSGTGIANGDDLRVGTGETMELVRVTAGGGTASLTLAKPLKYDHANGEAVVEQAALNLGVPEADGVRFRFNGETTDVFSAVSRLAYGVLTGYVDIGLSWRWPGVTVDALAMAFGIPRANVIGDGTAAVQSGTAGPRLFTTDGVQFSAITNVNAVLTGTLMDGANFKLDAYNITFDPTAVSLTLARGQLSTTPARALASGAAADFTNAVFTPANPINTFAASKGDLFDQITAVYSLADSGTANTTASQVNAGAYTIPLTLATGFAANDIVKIGVGDLAEYHYVHSITTNTLNLRTQVLRQHASGVAVVKQTPTALGIAQGGFTIATAGSVETMRSELSRVSLGYRAQNVAVTFSFSLDAIRPESFYLAMGIAASEYNVGGSLVLPMNNNIGRSSVVPLYFVGLTQGGKTISMLGWNGAAQINGETQFTQAATALIPVAYKPNGMNVWVNS